MIQSETFATNWCGPVWNALNEKGPINTVDLNKPKSITQFFTRNADNYISRHDVSLFKKWSVNVVHVTLMQIDDIESRLKFVIHLLRPHRNDNNKRFILGKTFKKLSKDADGLKWCEYFSCSNFKFDQKDALQLFTKWLEGELMKLNKNPINSNKRKRKRIKIEDDDDKINKIKQILSTLNPKEQQSVIMELLMEMVHQNSMTQSSKRRRLSSQKSMTNDINLMNNNQLMMHLIVPNHVYTEAVSGILSPSSNNYSLAIPYQFNSNSNDGQTRM